MAQHLSIDEHLRGPGVYQEGAAEGFIDLIVLLMVSVVVLLLLIPFLIGTVRIVTTTQLLDQDAWNLLRAATISGKPPPNSITVDGNAVAVDLTGALTGCSVAHLTLRTHTTLPGLGVLGTTLSTYAVEGSATIAIGAYRNPDDEGINCAPLTTPS